MIVEQDHLEAPGNRRQKRPAGRPLTYRRPEEIWAVTLGKKTQERVDERRTQFSPAWFEMAALLVAIGLIVHQRGLLALAACLLTVIPIAWWWKRLSLRRVEYERCFDKQRAFPGETLEMTVRITNRKLLPLTWLEVSDEMPIALPLVQGALMPTHIPQIGTLDNVLSLRWYERVSRRYELECTARGIYTLGPVHLKSGDIFTLFESHESRKNHDRLVVYPRIWPLADLGLPSKELFGERKAHRRLLEDPLRTIGIRDYRPEDGLRRIHWKATAHRGELQVRVCEPTTTLSLVILLNVCTFEHHWQGVIPELLERTISVAGSIATWAVGQKYKVGLVANGCMPLSDQPIRVPPGRSPGQLAAILEALAAVTSFATLSIQELLRRESPRLPWGATLVVVTAIVTDELAAAILRLRRAGRRMALVSLADEPPPQLDGVATYHLPSSTPAFQHFSEGPYDATAALEAAGLTPREARGG
ncbi:MAG: DUF58 domain-containing protein [Chloroflexi bacterium]|nr:MAG: DUF58 domain-containing protein [Chloroflexota bacterium]HEY66757.1 DUF58 domain-containing protein [Thermoflexia bacterium]